MRWSSGKSMATVLGLLCCFFLIILIVTYRTSAKLVENYRLQSRSFIILKKLESVSHSLIDAESGERGYIITGDGRYLDPYYAALANIDREMKELRPLVIINPEHMHSLDVIGPLLAEKLNGLNERIMIRKNEGFEAAAREVRIAKGRIIMERIRKIINDMEDRESNILGRNIAEMEKSGRKTFFIILFGGSFCLLVVAIANIFTYHELKKRKQTEEALQQSEERFKTIFDNANDGILVTDKETRKHILANKTICTMLGYDKDELLSMEVLRLHREEDLPHAMEGFEEFSAGKSMRRENIPFRRKDGTVVYVDVSSANMNIDGRSCMMGIFRDITERKRAEGALQAVHDELEQRVEERTSALRESEERFRTLAETSLAGIYIFQGERFIYVNPMMEFITGYNKEELLGMPFWSAVHPDFRDLVRERGLARQRGEPVPSRYELKILRKDGEERWIFVYAAAFQYQGREAALGTAFDITERKQAEEKIWTYQNQLRSLAAELTLAEERERRRIATTLHDQVIQMLALCKINIEVFKESHAEGSIKYIDEISGLLEQTIHYTRSLVLDLSPPILYTLGFEAAVEWLGEQILERNGIKFHFRDDSYLKPLQDDARIILFLAVRELMFNIVKHSKALEAKVAIQKLANSIQIVVEDNGIGFNASGVGPVRGHGGFGLFNIREQLYGIGGQLRVESGQGQGTRITMLAPIN